MAFSILICLCRRFRFELSTSTYNDESIYFVKIYSRDSFSETRDYVVSAISLSDYITLREIFKIENS